MQNLAILAKLKIVLLFYHSVKIPKKYVTQIFREIKFEGFRNSNNAVFIIL